MRAFERDGDTLVADLEDYEVAMLASLVEQLNELLGDTGERPAPASDDPFDRWEVGFGGVTPLDHDDPLVQRLFPDAYADDHAAAEDFRRFTEDELRRSRIRAGHVVLRDLRATREGRRPLVVAQSHADAWLQTVNGLRLSLSVRLGIVDEHSHTELEALPARDPRSQLMSLYDWLGFVLESLVDALPEAHS